MESVELICKKMHMPWPNVRIPANTKIVIGPPEIAEALCRRGFFEKVPPEVPAQETRPPDQRPKQKAEQKGK